MAKGGKRVGAGRKRTPTGLKLLEGTFRKDRARGEPPVVPGFPAAPGCLSEAERGLWETFPKPTWIGQTDVVAVHAAVSMYARVIGNQQAQRVADEDKTRVLVDQELKLWGRLMSILGTLGLTPADRSKMQAPKSADVEDKWAGIL